MGLGGVVPHGREHDQRHVGGGRGLPELAGDLVVEVSVLARGHPPGGEVTCDQGLAHRLRPGGEMPEHLGSGLFQLFRRGLGRLLGLHLLQHLVELFPYLLGNQGRHVLMEGVEQEQAGHLTGKTPGLVARVGPAQRVAYQQVGAGNAGGVEQFASSSVTSAAVRGSSAG